MPNAVWTFGQATGFDTGPYGNFSADRTRWETYPAGPRFGVQYFSLSNKLTYAVRGRIGYGGSFLGHELPFFERFRLGGERSVRGFGGSGTRSFWPTTSSISGSWPSRRLASRTPSERSARA